MTFSPHDELARAILEVITPRGGELRLLGRLADPMIENTSDREIFFFIPDLHMLSPERTKKFGAYQFNHAETLAAILSKLAALRGRWELEGTRRLITVQLGDFFDLWREFSGDADLHTLADNAHGEIRDLLYRGSKRGKPCLGATMLLGNHDTKHGKTLPEISFHLSRLNHPEAPFLFTTHGDAFDALEAIAPDPLQEFVVQMFGGMPISRTISLNKPLSELGDFIMKAEHGLEGSHGAPKVTPGAPLPARHLEVATAADRTSHTYFEKFYESIAIARTKGFSAASVKVVVIGHSHHARMILAQPPGQRAMLLIDAGAWIERCKYQLDDGTTITEPNAQLAVIHGNDARLYQVRPGAL